MTKAELTDEERQEAERQARAEYLAALKLDKLLAEASDQELDAESWRCGREMDRLHTRGPGISRAQALQRLEDALAGADAHVDRALQAAVDETISRPSGPRLSTLQAAVAAHQLQSAAHHDLRRVIADKLEPDDQRIFKTDPKKPVAEKRRELDSRRSEISVELERRGLERRTAALGPRPKKGKK
jgi:hypothetical protein